VPNTLEVILKKKKVLVLQQNVEFNLNQKTQTYWWRQSGSNRRPPACKAGALPAELCPLHFLPSIMVGLGRLELPTSPLSGVRSNHLSYRPALTRFSFSVTAFCLFDCLFDCSFAFFFSLFLPSNKCGYLRQLLSLDIFVRR
jgi:hypothetical protein